MTTRKDNTPTTTWKFRLCAALASGLAISALAGCHGHYASHHHGHRGHHGSYHGSYSGDFNAFAGTALILLFLWSAFDC
jgi:hypothetical protein